MATPLERDDRDSVLAAETSCRALRAVPVAEEPPVLAEPDHPARTGSLLLTLDNDEVGPTGRERHDGRGHGRLVVANGVTALRLDKVAAESRFLSVTRCALCRHLSEQKRASARLPLNFVPQAAHVVAGR